LLASYQYTLFYARFILVCVIFARFIPISIIFTRYIPESFRWLIANKKVEKAEEIIRKIARINNVSVPDTSKLAFLVDNSVTDDKKKYTYLDIILNAEHMKKTVLLAVVW
jgi:hypothetical protein